MHDLYRAGILFAAVQLEERAVKLSAEAKAELEECLFRVSACTEAHAETLREAATDLRAIAGTNEPVTECLNTAHQNLND